MRGAAAVTGRGKSGTGEAVITRSAFVFYLICPTFVISFFPSARPDYT